MSVYENNQGRTVLLYSGGLDSLCIYSLLRKQGKEFDALYIRHDLIYHEQEEASLYKLNAKYGVEVSMNNTHVEPYQEIEQKDGFIPLRNMLFATLAGMLGYSTILLGAVYGESSRDKSEKFYHNFSDLASYLLDREIRLRAPYSYLTKAQLVEKALNEGAVTKHMLLDTWSCYNPHENRKGQDIHCGKCLACYRRWVALTRNGIEEEYAFDPSKFVFGQMRKNPLGILRRFIRQPRERKVELLKNNVDGVFTTVRHKLGKNNG